MREKRGLAYSAYSYFHPLRRRGPWIAGLQTRNDQADQAVAVLRKTVAGFIAKGPGVKAVNVGTIGLNDVAPTALAVLGIGKPESMSGKVLPCVP